MKSLKPITILTLLPTPLTSLVIPLFSPLPSPTTGIPSQINPPPLKTNHSKRNPLSPSSVIDAIIHLARPPDDPDTNGSRPLITAEPKSGIDALNIDPEALKKAISGGGGDNTGTLDNGGAESPEKPPGIEELEFKKNIIRL
ncbi:uncharacterized protein DFL_009842 [Arthrobotrys flagrans]|uniref:Uncharacterized protein n=1 Tax=Arthrobotrys flagrans TaxID=97331 RepID=A0A436ZSY9_ARTFL|nr:hypothetical protein DFL_009842 [Arthrobotrys flagrans]